MNRTEHTTHTQDPRQTLILDLTELGARVAGEQMAEDNVWIVALLEERFKGSRFTYQLLEEN